MGKYIIISNRLPVTIQKTENGMIYKKSIGGLATGVSTIHEMNESLWIGWPGISSDTLNKKEIKEIHSQLKKKYQCIPVYLDDKELEQFYHGFCNETIWPLFHYFPNRTKYDHAQWETYKQVNEKYYNEVKSILQRSDTVWIHDYQLLLLPLLIRKEFPNISTGFFLHIPFPSFEIFRLLPWREKILNGILGADLIGFHTYDYVRHFLSSVRRILRIDYNLGSLNVNNRKVYTDVFPMGIDFDKYSKAHLNIDIKKETKNTFTQTHGVRIILSVDRLDYTKGIPERIRAFNRFLEKYSEYKGKVNLILIVAPSRTKVDMYQNLLLEIEELVSKTNGKYGTIGWIPIWFFNRAFDFNKLTALYLTSDVLLVTPLRDGMNLVAKEYIAAKNDNGGSVIVSETAGAASELGEAFVVNANNIEEIADTIHKALKEPLADQKKKNLFMLQRLKRYNVRFWANDFIERLHDISSARKKENQNNKLKDDLDKLLAEYKMAERRLLLLDYDGTLKDFYLRPEQAVPDRELISLIKNLAEDKKNKVVIISGRARKNINNWFRKIPICLVADHGLWVLDTNQEWRMMDHITNEWMETIRPILEIYVDRTPGSFIEEKKHSLAWHYRKCEPDLIELRIPELKAALMSMTENMNLNVLEGHKVIEVKNNTINKGRSASYYYNKENYQFVIAIGDDTTDEDMFQVLPDTTYTIKVGHQTTAAKYNVTNVAAVRKILFSLIESD